LNAVAMSLAIKHPFQMRWTIRRLAASSLGAFRPNGAAFVCVLIWGLCTIAHAQRIHGLSFPVGEPADDPAAKVRIEEISQGSQKRGFFRISILPLMVAKGVEIRLQRAEIGVLAEMTKALRSLVKLDAQEFQKVTLFYRDEAAPRLLAEVATPVEGSWALKRVRVKTPTGFRELADCTLHFTGANSGRLISQNGEPLTLDLTSAPRP
jgi:hypothetical protein